MFAARGRGWRNCDLIRTLGISETAAFALDQQWSAFAADAASARQPSHLIMSEGWRGRRLKAASPRQWQGLMAGFASPEEVEEERVDRC